MVKTASAPTEDLKHTLKSSTYFLVTFRALISKTDTGDWSNIMVESGLFTDNTTQSVKGTTAQFHNAHHTRLVFFLYFVVRLGPHSIHYMMD